MTEEILKAYEVLEKGGIILYPTDTIWGIGCDATKVKPVERIFKIKKRDPSRSMIILLDQFEKLYRYVEKVPAIALDLINSIDTPLTIVYPGGKNLAKNLLAEDGSIGIRIVKNEFCQRLISLLNAPLVSSSANLSGQASPLMFCKISPEIIKSVDYAVDFDRDTINQVRPSTVIKFTDDENYHIIRT